MRVTRILGALAMLGWAIAQGAQAQQKSVLAKPSAEYAESFTSITAIRELPSGKVLVADRADKIVQLVDLIAGTASKVGREGSGPGEYALPMTLLALPDGSTLIQDPLNRRFVMVGTDGKPGAFVDMPRPPSNGNGAPVMLMGGFDARGVDSKGRIYFQAAPFGPGGATLDSVAILRWERATSAMDTVGFVKLPAGSATASASGGNMRVMIGGGKRFAPAETWGVAADGRVARVLPEPYRVVWVAGPSQMTAGPIVPYTPMKVTEADKQEFIEAQKRARPMLITMGGPGPGPRPGGGGGGGGANFQAPPPEFADTKPPFVAGPGGGGSVAVTPEGEVWVLRTRPAGDKIPTYDVFDRSGTLVKKVSLNPSSRVIGFGKGSVYVVRTDEDDLQYLQRYARP